MQTARPMIPPEPPSWAKVNHQVLVSRLGSSWPAARASRFSMAGAMYSMLRKDMVTMPPWMPKNHRILHSSSKMTKVTGLSVRVLSGARRMP